MRHLSVLIGWTRQARGVDTDYANVNRSFGDAK
jgi:hypothetical protein